MSMNATLAAILLGALVSLAADDEIRALEGEELHAARAVIAAVAEELEDSEVVHARYVQRQQSLLLAEPLVSRGRLHLRSDPGCLILAVEEPRRAVLRSDATSHQVWDVEKKRAERYEFESNELARALIACFTADLEDVERTFVLTGLDERGEPGAEEAVLRLTPRSKRLKVVLRSLQLTIRRVDSALTDLSYTNAEGESVEFEFTQITRDPEDDPDIHVFDMPLPEDVELVVRRVEVEGVPD